MLPWASSLVHMAMALVSESSRICFCVPILSLSIITVGIPLTMCQLVARETVQVCGILCGKQLLQEFTQLQSVHKVYKYIPCQHQHCG